MGPESNLTGVLMKGDTQTEGTRGHVKTEAKTRATQLQAQGGQGLPACTEAGEEGLLPGASEGAWPCLGSDL